MNLIGWAMVITMSMHAKIHRMHFREKPPISETVRRTSLSRNTIKKWLRERERDELKYVRPPAKTKLDPFLVQVRQWQETDAHRPKRGRRTLLVLFRELQAKGYAAAIPA